MSTIRTNRGVYETGTTNDGISTMQSLGAAASCVSDWYECILSYRMAGRSGVKPFPLAKSRAVCMPLILVLSFHAAIHCTSRSERKSSQLHGYYLGRVNKYRSRVGSHPPCPSWEGCGGLSSFS